MTVVIRAVERDVSPDRRMDFCFGLSPLAALAPHNVCHWSLKSAATMIINRTPFAAFAAFAGISDPSTRADNIASKRRALHRSGTGRLSTDHSGIAGWIGAILILQTASQHETAPLDWTLSRTSQSVSHDHLIKRDSVSTTLTTHIASPTKPFYYDFRSQR